MQASCLSHKTFFAKHLTRCRVVHSCRFFQSEDIRTAAAGQANCRGVKGSGRILTLLPEASPFPRQRSAGRGLGRGAQMLWQTRAASGLLSPALSSRGGEGDRLVVVSSAPLPPKV